uniref:Uncharacterized protein n=1 Tax=Terrapene triunguis TaxID=2587831 RepID=A0A674JRL6_9SAUR
MLSTSHQILFFFGAVPGEALRCNVCKRKFLLFGCVQGSGETTCGWRERCVNIKASLGMYGFQGLPTSNCLKESSNCFLLKYCSQLQIQPTISDSTEILMAHWCPG